MSQVAARTLDLLETIAGSPRPLRLMELVESTGVDKSTATRLLGFLQERGLIGRDPVTRRYVIGAGLLSLSAVAMHHSALPELAATDLLALRDETGETASLHLRVGAQRVCVAGAEGRAKNIHGLSPGDRVPLSTGPSGWVMLAFLPETDIRMLTPATSGRESQRLADQLSEIRRRGSISLVDEASDGVGAISVPIFDGHAPVASLTVAGPGRQWNLDAMRRVEPRMTAVASRLSAALQSSVAA
jgi:DNA-binding IclR family transcriptional regulator